ncbi:MAG: hypothetical protein QNJ68_01015 [Microcoleaceae cyanobacterium MO_207.B10]|nr:hypothetical protein [Microcoleaceae cyanobacterium MO_207.B10]
MASSVVSFQQKKPGPSIAVVGIWLGTNLFQLHNMTRETKSPVLLDNIDLTPTQIAQELTEKVGEKTSARKVNQVLEKLGLQQKLKSKRGKWQWELTEMGKKYARVYQVESRQSKWTGNQIKWSQKIIDLLAQEIFLLLA